MNGIALRRMAVAAGALLAMTGLALAAQPVDRGLTFQPAATPIMEEIVWFHNAILLPIITATCLFVLGLLIYVAVRFNQKSNPVPSKTTHNQTLEVVWTVVPIIILIVIAIPSFQLLYREQTIPRPDMTVKVTGYQWYWGYEYPDHGGFRFDSYMMDDAARALAIRNGRPANETPRLLAVDNEMVVPVNAVVRVQVTANDVLHAFAMPAFGVKIDAVPGRLNETWFKATRPGLYFGQCSELCGKDHAFMPLAIRVVSQQEFATWVDGARRRFASNPAIQTAVAAD